MTKPLFNPYDFANPVHHADMFAGRKSERDDVKYYLELARHTRPIHLAITGERAAGKTSMLNLIEREAEQMGFLVVRMDLNEGDADPLQFFGGLYDAIMTEAVGKGAYAGMSGHVYTAYRGLMDAGVAANLPLSFPSHLVATSSGSRKLSTPILTADLALLSAEVGRTIVIVLDECNVLSQSRITLEIIRNLFMNLEGFMLVLAGTPNLFPIIDDVYSPIARQFKKVELSPFEDESETEECITLPLAQAGLEPEEVFQSLPDIVGETHRISGGRPYEIQLLCHTMFKRMQLGKEEHLVLNLEALETVRKELEQRQGHDSGRVAHLYADLNDSDLNVLSMLRRVRGGDPTRAVNISVTLPEPEIFNHVPEKRFFERLKHMEEIGVLEVVGGEYKLTGDQFDEVYLRYLAASHDIFIPAVPAPPAIVVHYSLLNMLEVPKALRPQSFWIGLDEDKFAKRISPILEARSSSGRASDADLRLWRKLYAPLDVAQDIGSELTYLQINVSMGDIKTINHYNMKDSTAADRFEGSVRFQDFVSAVEARGGTVETKRVVFDIAGLAPVAELVPRDLELLANISSQYQDIATDEYELGNYASALRAFEKSYRLLPSSKAAVAVAFQLLCMGDWQSAIDWTYRADVCVAREGDVEHDHSLLATFDRGVAHLMLGQVNQARLEFESLKEDGSENGPVYLRVPFKNTDGTWSLKDETGSILKFATELLRQL